MTASRTDTADGTAPHGPQAGPASPRPDRDWERARSIAGSCADKPLPAVPRTLADALGHALAEPLVALTDLPSFDTAAMDGWAVAGPGPWRLGGARVLAGEESGPLGRDTAVPIATGAPVPPGTTAVLRCEHGEPDPEQDLLYARSPGPVCEGHDIRPRGQECRSGEPLLPAGTTVTARVLGLAAAAGYDRLSVHRRPSVELFVLGDELLEQGVPRGGRVRDALGPLLPPWLHGRGAELIGHRRIADDPGLLREAVRRSPADVVVTTGSTAAGPVDFLHDTLRAVGARLLVDSVAVRPGHPMLLAELPATADGRARRLVGLPGNPLAAVAGLVTLAEPLLRHLGGHRDTGPVRLAAAAALPGHPRDTRLVPVFTAGQQVTPLPFDGPAMLRGLALADGLAVVPPGGVPAGATVDVLELPGR
ncbi:molybdopterin molybdotransferase MoeA [Streptomyces sp. MMG1121]|uniref:molybdopterin molybdotransferase MoeA n=1 Tax=Streptomyces sp. MMG1121 TaxID=1415544 RepID=UPI0006ADB378|nr:molybdopterin molybdotransferase MoeA [Streptomyces sp. MMG1121]KOV68796.1 molybdopterin biosynthesis protein [Streptomyces sp. MMG1121]